MKSLAMLLLISVAAITNAATTIQNEFITATRNGEKLLLSSTSGSQKITVKLPGFIKGVQSAPCQDSIWGAGQQLTVDHAGNTTTLTLYDGNAWAHIETSVGNDEPSRKDIQKLIIAKMELDLDTEPTKLVTLGTGGRREYDQPEGSYAYSVLADPQSRNGVVCGWLTQRRGVGLMLPSFKDGIHALETQLDFGLMRLEPGQTRETDILAIGVFSDARLGLEQYADQVAKVYNIKLPPKPNVYCTWYHRKLTGSGASNEKMLAENAAFARKQLQPFGLDVIQIDDHWQALENDPGQKNKGPVKTFISTTKHFPNGMAKTAATLKKEGFVPGIWYMPFAGDLKNPTFDAAIFAKNKATGGPFDDNRWSGTTIDASNPRGEAFLRSRFKRIHEWGYRYIKTDGLHIGTPSHNIYVNRSYNGETFGNAEIYDKGQTFIEAYRKGLGILREENPDTFILGCSATQNMVSFAPVFGMIDAMRVGPDNDRARQGNWKNTTRGADFAGNLWFLNNRVWYNDPDPFYVRSTNPLNKAHWMASWLAVSGAMNTTSMQYSELAHERLDIIKRTLPAHNLNARPIDILENDKPQIWKVANNRLCVLGLFNWNEKQEVFIDYPLERMDLDPNKSYDAFDFWENRYIGTISGNLETTLQGAHCRVLALRETANHPQLLSTSRHITQGLMDVLSENWNPLRNQLHGSSQVVAADPYEMHIVCPGEYKVKGVEVPVQNAAVSNIEHKDGITRVTIKPKTTGQLEWKILF